MVSNVGFWAVAIKGRPAFMCACVCAYVCDTFSCAKKNGNVVHPTGVVAMTTWVTESRRQVRRCCIIRSDAKAHHAVDHHRHRHRHQTRRAGAGHVPARADGRTPIGKGGQNSGAADDGSASQLQGQDRRVRPPDPRHGQRARQDGKYRRKESIFFNMFLD